jgi:hypothetical protein
METWSASLLANVKHCLSTHHYWSGHTELFTPSSSPHKTVHLAVFSEPFLQFLLEGRKTVESRFSIHKRPPFDRVTAADIVLVKEAGGPVVALAEVSHVWYYKLNTQAWEFIRNRFGRQLCMDRSEFWKNKDSSAYATLMQFARVDSLEPISCGKRDRRGWVVLDSLSPKQANLFTSEQNAPRTHGRA